MRPKKKPIARSNESEISGILRWAGVCIGRRKIPQALDVINEALADLPEGSKDRTRLIALAADADYKRGRFASAASIYLQAATLGINAPRYWRRACVGHVRSLLRVPDVDQAATMAWHTIDAAQAKQEAFDAGVAAANAALANDEPVASEPLPLRVDKIACQFGNIFLQEGEIDIAESLFHRAIAASKGAIKAYIGLSTVFLMKGHNRSAMWMALQALYAGRFTAKTLPAWSVFIKARRRLGYWRVREGLLIDMKQAAAPSLCDRTILTIVRELRENDMRQWQDVISYWRTKEWGGDRLHREFQKMLLGSNKKETNNLVLRKNTAQQMFSRGHLGIRDWLAGAKEYVRSGLLLDPLFSVDDVLQEAYVRFGSSHMRKIRHSLARSCEEAGELAIAQSLLLQNTTSFYGSKLWSQSVWALARVQSAMGDFLNAADTYLLFTQHNTTEHFNIQANILRIQVLIQAGDTDQLPAIKTAMETIAGDISNPELILNIARQLRDAPPEFQEWRQQLILQGEAELLNQIHNAEHPSVAIKMLFKLTRRQVLDFGRNTQAIALWEGFDDDKRDWLWSTSATFWEYMGMLFEAYTRANQWEGAEQFAEDLMNDPATPAEHLPFIGVPLVRQLLHRQRVADGLALCHELTLKAPRHPLCSWAWYWLALDAYQQEDMDKARHCAAKIREAQGAKPGLLEDLDLRALYILADMDSNEMDTSSPTYNARRLPATIQKVGRDMALLQ